MTAQRNKTITDELLTMIDEAQELLERIKRRAEELQDQEEGENDDA